MFEALKYRDKVIEASVDLVKFIENKRRLFLGSSNMQLFGIEIQRFLVIRC